MRIFQVIEAKANSSVSNNQTWYRNLYEPLIDLGHEVFLFRAEDASEAMARKNVGFCAKFSQQLIDKFKQEHQKKHFDLFFSYLKDGMVEASIIDQIREIGVSTCNFSCNNTHQFHLVKNLSPHFDYNLHSEKDVREKFLKIGATPLWWPMASNPKYFKPQNIPREIPVSFVGANYGLRAKYASYLLKNKIDVHLYGPGWVSGSRTRTYSTLKYCWLICQTISSISYQDQARASSLLADHAFRRALSASFPKNMHLPVTDDELIRLYSSSKISLGFLEVYDNHNPNDLVKRHLHLREFEAPMSGALYCTGYIDELAEFFELDKEVIVYRNEEELLDKIRYYLTHESEAQRIRSAGYQRAISDHTYHNRYKQLFRQINI